MGARDGGAREHPLGRLAGVTRRGVNTYGSFCEITVHLACLPSVVLFSTYFLFFFFFGLESNFGKTSLVDSKACDHSIMGFQNL